MQQQVSEQGSAISAHGDTNTLLENMIANLNVHIVQEKVVHFRNFPGVLKGACFVFWYFSSGRGDFCLY